MAELFRTGAFPRLIDRIIIRTEATIFLFGALFLILVVRNSAVNRADNDTPMRAVVEVISSDSGIVGLGLAAGAVGGYALWSIWKKANNHLRRAIFGFFMVRLYTFLATIITMNGVQDTRWLNHLPWIIIWGSYFVLSRHSRHE